MRKNFSCLRKINAGLVGVLGVVAVASCAPVPSAPQQVQSTSPTVTYNYRTDQELVQANQNAMAFCGQYQTTPRTASVTNSPDGGKTVVFECVRTAATPPVPPAPPAPPSQTYTYRTDQELVQASQTASAYCARYGSQPMTSSIVVNPNGTRTATFQCGAR